MTIPDKPPSAGSPSVAIGNLLTPILLGVIAILLAVLVFRQPPRIVIQPEQAQSERIEIASSTGLSVLPEVRCGSCSSTGKAVRACFDTSYHTLTSEVRNAELCGRAQAVRITLPRGGLP